MATDSAPTNRDTVVSNSTRTISPMRPHNYWQLPVFILGLSAILVVWKQFPPPQREPDIVFQDDLQRLQALMERRPLDIASIDQLVNRLQARIQDHPTLQNQAHFQIGSAYVRLAEMQPLSTDPELWKKANQHFTECDVSLLTDPVHQARCIYRSAKSAAALNIGDPQLLMAALTIIPPGDEIGQRSLLMAQTAERLNPPDYQRAKEELGQFLSSTNKLAPEMLANLQLRMAEFHMRLADRAGARTWLTQISTNATSEVLAMSKVMAARMATQEQNWSEAAQLLEAAQSTPGLPAEQLGMILLETGDAYLAANQLDKALRNFEQSSQRTGPAQSKALWQWVRTALKQPGNAEMPKIYQALQKLSTQEQEIESKTEWKQLVQIYAERIAPNGQLPELDQALALLTPVSDPMELRRHRATIYSQWLEQVAPNSQSSEVIEKRKQVIQDWLELANYAEGNPPIQAEFLVTAAKQLKISGDTQGATETLEKLIKLSSAPETILQQAKMQLGEIHLAQGRFQEGVQLLKSHLSESTPQALQAQLMFAKAHLEESKRKLSSANGNPLAMGEAQGYAVLGQKVLERISQTTFTTPAELDVQQQALFELGKLLMAKSLPDAESRFRQMVQLNPAGPLSERGKLYLGSCLLLLARGDSQRGQIPADARKKLEEARMVFESLAQSKDPWMQAQGDIRVANATLLLKKYDEMPALCETLTKRYAGRVEELIVLSMLCKSYQEADRAELANQTLDQMRKTFENLPATAFSGGTSEYTQEYWQTRWFKK